MKFVSSREIRVNPRPVFENLENQEVVLTTRGKPVALLLSVSGDDLEETVQLVRRAKAQAATSRMRKSAAERGSNKLSQEEIAEEIDATRSEHSES